MLITLNRHCEPSQRVKNRLIINVQLNSSWWPIPHKEPFNRDQVWIKIIPVLIRIPWHVSKQITTLTPATMTDFTPFSLRNEIRSFHTVFPADAFVCVFPCQTILLMGKDRCTSRSKVLQKYDILSRFYSFFLITSRRR